MKKLLLVAIGVLSLSIAMVSAASANGGPHGNYTATTDKCAGCHRAHTAAGDNLLIVGGTITAFCETCHGAGTGAQTDVKNGVFKGTGPTNIGDGGLRLNGGGFEMIGSAPIKSAHVLDTAGKVAWGGMDGNNLAGELECTSCHNPHGSTSYRMLRNEDNKGHGSTPPDYLGWTTGALGWSTANVPYNPLDVSKGGDFDSATQGYTWVAEKIVGLGLSTGVSSTSNRIQASYSENMNEFCAACHTKYNQPSGGAATAWSSAPIAMGTDSRVVNRHGHATDRNKSMGTSAILNPLVFARPATDLSSTADNRLNCLTCHFAHGTTAAMSGWATTDPADPNHNTSGVNIGATNGSANLFWDNRGVCQGCHNK